MKNTPERKTVPIFFAVDDNYAPYLAVALESLKDNASDKYFYDINILGSISLKGTTKDARFGNPTPRIAECTSGLINSVGLQNPGVDKVISEELPKLKKCFNKKQAVVFYLKYVTIIYIMG